MTNRNRRARNRHMKNHGFTIKSLFFLLTKSSRSNYSRLRLQISERICPQRIHPNVHIFKKKKRKKKGRLVTHKSLGSTDDLICKHSKMWV